jgi:hypothetical protein
MVLSLKFDSGQPKDTGCNSTNMKPYGLQSNLDYADWFFDLKKSRFDVSLYAMEIKSLMVS